MNISSPTVIKTGDTVVIRVFVNKIPSVDGGVYNSSTVQGMGASNLISSIPAGSIGVLEIGAQIQAGLVIDPGTDGICSVTYT